MNSQGRLSFSLVLFSDKDNRFHWLPSSRNLRSSIPPAFGSVHVLYKALTGRDRVKAKRHPSPSSWALLVFSAFLSRDIPTAKATGSTPPNRRRNGAGDLCLWRVWRLCCFGSLFRPPNNIQVVKMSPQKRERERLVLECLFQQRNQISPNFIDFFLPSRPCCLFWGSRSLWPFIAFCSTSSSSFFRVAGIRPFGW